jgi:hypothetical protein
MGLDIYLKWNNQTDDERQAQFTGFRIDCGNVGYLRASWLMREEIELYSNVFKPNWDGLNDGESENIDFISQKQLDILEEEIKKYNKNTNISEEDRKIIIKSVREFYNLAKEKQLAGLNPRAEFR